MYRMIVLQKGRDAQDLVSPALWYQCQAPDDVVAKVHRYSAKMKFFENLHAYDDDAVIVSKVSEPVD